MVAKVDSAAVQDGFDLYLHGFIVTDDGHWPWSSRAGDASRLARRYHWLSEQLGSFVDTPHRDRGRAQGQIVNLTHRRAQASRRRQLDLLRDLGPDGIVREISALEAMPPAPAPDQPLLPHLIMPTHHDVRPGDLMLRRLHGALAAAANKGLRASPTCCWWPVSARAPCAHWRWWRRWSTARPAASPTRRASRWPMAARTGGRFPVPTRSTTRPSRC